MRKTKVSGDKMTEQLLLEVWKNEGILRDEVPFYRCFIKEDYIVNRLRAVCPDVKNIAKATVLRLKLNGKVKLGKGVYTVYLYNEIDHSEEIQKYKDYRLSQLPTFVEYLLAMREHHCPDLVRAKEEFKNKIDEAYDIMYLARELLEVQVIETQVLMWDKLVGKKWSIVDQNLVTSSVEIHLFVLWYLDKTYDDIMVQASFGAASSTCPVSNVCENTKYKGIARWYREYAKQLRNLEEGKDYR